MVKKGGEEEEKDRGRVCPERRCKQCCFLRSDAKCAIFLFPLSLSLALPCARCVRCVKVCLLPGHAKEKRKQKEKGIARGLGAGTATGTASATERRLCFVLFLFMF